MEIIHLQSKHQFHLTGVYGSSVAWGDYDNDGDLDILLAGNPLYGSNGFTTKIYRNDYPLQTHSQPHPQICLR